MKTQLIAGPLVYAGMVKNTVSGILTRDRDPTTAFFSASVCHLIYLIAVLLYDVFYV
jgi:hypothetical protein